MANISIKELFGSDTITALTEKINYNFDQLILAGGGPEGPIGPTGNNGVAGPDGLRGSQWFGESGATGTINQPTDGTFRENDFKLNTNGDVVYYNNNIWNSAGINLTGPAGPTGSSGDGSIKILAGKNEFHPTWNNQFVPDYQQLQTYLATNFLNDKDDYDNNAVGFNNAGLDFIGLGRGNNSLVLGRYASMFRNTSTGAGGTFSPASGNKTMANLPSSESDVPMLFISQNDYKDPTEAKSFSNGIAIGLTKSQKSEDYTDGKFGVDAPMDYNDFANISIENRWMDFKIEVPALFRLKGKNSLSEFRLGTRTTRAGQSNVQDISTKLESQIYTEVNLNDSFVVTLSSNESNHDLGVIHRGEYNYTENKRIYNPTEDLRKNVSKSFVTPGDTTFTDGQANEIVLVNRTILETITTGGTADKGKVNNNYIDSNNFNSNDSKLPFRLGQTFVKVPVVSNGGPLPISQRNISLHYQGFGYDQSIISYSGNDDVFGGETPINTSGKPIDALLPNDNTLENYLGYDIKLPITDQEGSRSMSRMGLYPGLFRKEKVGGAYDNDGDPLGENRKDDFFDIAHKMLPTGSMDLYGTVRLRQQGETDNGAQDGWIAINKKDGIVTFEEPNKVNTTPTYAIMSFPELASNKFSFYVNSRKDIGVTGNAFDNALNFRLGSTGIGMAFPGKGSDELKDYYICNGAVLADERDILITGPYSKMKGMNVHANVDVENGFVNTGDSMLYTSNDKFEGLLGQTHSTFELDLGGTITSYGISYGNADFRRTYPIWGYSVLAPKTAESGFRIVLPNYFGRVQKMIFPDSDTIIRAVAGNTSSRSDYTLGFRTTGQHRGDGFQYYTPDKYYNSRWMMKGAFESLGFPYLMKQHFPDTYHAHVQRDLYTEVSDKSLLGGTGDWTLEQGPPTIAGGGFPITRYPKLTGEGTFSVSNEHTHREQQVNSYFEDSFMTENNYQYLTYYRDSKPLHPNPAVDLTPNFKDKPYTDKNPFGFGQKFIEPPFKGTYMAINLKGVRNPLRNNTLINDFHFIAGVPQSGISSQDDMSWGSYVSSSYNNIYEESQHTMTGAIYNTDPNDITPYLNDYNLNAIEYGFKAILRNDNTMHPYTFYNSNDSSGQNNKMVRPLDFTDPLLNNYERNTFDVYKTNISRNSIYDTRP